MLIDYVLGQTGIVLRVKIRNSSVSTGAGLTGLTSASSGLRISTIADNESSATAYTVAGSTIETISTLGTYAAPTATKARFSQLDATNHPGVYEIHIANARFAVSSAKSLLVSVSGATSAAECDAVIPLRSVNPYDGAAFGLSRLDAAVTTRMATFTLPTNFSALSITAGGLVTLAATQVFNNTGAWTGSISGSVGSISGITFPTHFSVLSIDASGLVKATNASGEPLARGEDLTLVADQLAEIYDGSRVLNVGDVTGKVLGGGSGTIAGVGAWVLGNTGSPIGGGGGGDNLEVDFTEIRA
jgi:hypothetical protein